MLISKQLSLLCTTFQIPKQSLRMCSKSTIDREDKNHSAILFSVPVFVDLFRLAEKERSSHCIQSRTSQMLIKNRKSQVLVQVGGS